MTIRMHRGKAQLAMSALPLGMLPEPIEDLPDPFPKRELHHQEERCEGCRWPRYCEMDTTCWQVEREKAITQTSEPLRKTTKKWTDQQVIAALRLFYQRNGRVPTTTEWKSRKRGPEYPGWSTVDAHFGSWKEAIIAAGLKPNPAHGRRPSR